jgi:hypothetical protein
MERKPTTVPITAAGNAGITVRLGDPIGDPEHGRYADRIDRLWRVAPDDEPGATYSLFKPMARVRDQDGEIRLEIFADWFEFAGAYIADSVRRYT